MHVVAADIRIEAAEATCALLPPHGARSIAVHADVTSADAMVSDRGVGAWIANDLISICR